MKKNLNNMFKDYSKYLSVSLIVYLIVLIITFILKVIGLDYFNLDITNPVMIKLNKIVWNFKIREIWYIFTLWLYAYLIISIVCNNKKVKTISLIVTIINVISILTIKYYMIKPLRSLFDIFLLYGACLIASKQNIKTTLKKTTLCIILYTFFQCISMITRKGNMEIEQDDFISLFILNFDYILMMLISYKLYFMKGGIQLCGMVEVGLSSLKKMNLKNLQKRLQKNYSNFKKQDKKYKATIIIYLIMSAIWNVLTVGLIILIALLNNTLVECIFIMTSFFITKRVFGKPFHLKKMISCFIVSNCSYYVLNRITTPIGISILIPVLLGVGLSYFTSKLVKKTYKPLYKGMSEELFNETILKVVDKDSDKYKICYEYFVQKKTYAITKMASRVNTKIKGLNN